MTTTAAQRVAFLGLGVMGYPMAGHLARAGHHVTVYNRTPDKAAKWVAAHGGASAATPAAAAKGASLVLMCVGNDDDVRAVATGKDGALAGMAPGTILVDHTTASAQVAREVHAVAAAKGVGFLDAPVSGGQAGAENGKLTVMVGGDAATYARAEGVLANFARAVTLMGGPGSGQLTKMVNQICIAGLVQGLSEGINFAQRAGLDAERVLDVISKGAAQSWQMENRGKTMVADKFDFGFAVDWMRKDLAICAAEARAWTRA
jgi:3-hydroxyisobutyrate dehydrogenase